MSGPMNGQPPGQKLELNATQLATLLLFDGISAQMQTAMNQLGGFLSLKREAEMIAKALAHLNKDKEQLMLEWQRKVQLVPASAMPPAPIIPNKS